MSGTNERSIPKLDHKLTGQNNYASWILSIEMCLTLYDVGKTECTIWDIVTGKLKKPSDIIVEKGEEISKTGVSATEWTKANYFALLTMKKNCEDEPLTKFELAKEAHEAYQALRNHYEGRTITDLGVVLADVIRYTYDDRQNNIEEHIAEYEKKWGFMRSTLNSGNFTENLQKFGYHLKGLSESDAAKAEFLLLSLPPYYNTLVENLRTKENYSYGDIVRSLKLYVPARQRNRKGAKGAKAETGSISENPVVLKTDTQKRDNNKSCRYCKEEKGWRGIGHEEDECFTKKRDLEKKKDAKQTDTENKDDSDDKFVHTIRLHTPN
jgi:hypothetical protein